MLPKHTSRRVAAHRDRAPPRAIREGGLHGRHFPRCRSSSTPGPASSTAPTSSLDGGILHLVHDSVTPEQARIDDLLLVADALEQAGVRSLLIRHDRAVPALVADLADRDAAIAALAALGTPRAAVREGAQPAGRSSPRRPIRSRRRRPRCACTARGSPGRAGLRYGSSLAARLEFWRFGDELVEAPNDNALTRRLTAAGRPDLHRGRALRTDVAHDLRHVRPPARRVHRRRRHGLLVGGRLVERLPAPARRPDGRVRRRRRRRRTGALPPCRRAALRAAQRPHVRALGAAHLHRHRLAGAGVAARSPQGHHRPQRGVLRRPVGAADPQLARRRGAAAPHPGLAEHFLYSNDDMFFGRLVEPELFFTAAGVIAVRRVRGAHRRRCPARRSAAATTTGCG